MITKLLFPDEVVNHYVFASNESYIDKVNRLNIFIGPNNSGKSRFLRNIFSDRELRIEVSEFDLKIILDIFTKILNEISSKLF